MTVPDRYEINAGIIGNMHGEKNDPTPDSAEIKILPSTNSCSSCQFLD
jgi:hypothetical protein